MLVSILITVYNAEVFLNRTIDSVLKQDYPDIEIILFDDASSDASRSIMYQYQKKYPQKVYAYHTDINGGIGKSKNSALKFSRGEYVFFMDCDDYFMEENYISDMVTQLKGSRLIDIVFSGFKNVNDEGLVNYEKIFKTEKEALFQSIPLFAKLYRKDFLIQNNIMSPEGIFLEDVAYQAVILGNEPNCRVSKINGYCWVQNLKSVSHYKLKLFSDNPAEHALDYFKVYETNNSGSIKNKKLYMLGIFQYYCWHILRIGISSSEDEIVRESNKFINFMNNYGEFKDNNFIVKGSKNIVYVVMKVMYSLYKVGLLNSFLKIYAKYGFFFRKFWPEL